VGVAEGVRRGAGDALRDRALLRPARLRERMEALDRLEHRWIVASPEERIALEHWCTELETVNARLFRAIRDDIVRGEGGADALRAWASVAHRHDDTVDGERYDHLDALVGGVLQLDEPAEAAALADGMVFYQPTPARHVFGLVERLGLTAHDVFVDIGSGLGHVPLLMALCTPARCIGIERDAAYVASARRCAEALNLRNARFVAQDAREADLSCGTVFYLYTPFRGAMLDGMLARLRREAAGRAIRVCTLGPCTGIVAGEAWLATEDAMRPDVPVLFRSRWSA